MEPIGATTAMRLSTPKSHLDASQSISSTLFRSGPSMTHYLRPSLRPERSEWQPRRLEEDAVLVDDDLRKKLLAISSSFTALGKQVDDNARRRKELETRNCQELLVFLGKLEHELMEEARLRQREIQQLRQGVEERVATMLDVIQTRLSERFSSLLSSVDALTDRCISLELGIQQFKGSVPSQLQVEMTSLKEELSQLLEDFKHQQQQSFSQEDAFRQRLEEGGLNVDMEMQKELTRIERRAEALQETIDQFAPAEALVEKRASSLDQLAQLREQLDFEVSQRQAADDEVGQAISDYRTTLLRSLSVAQRSYN